MTYLSNGIHSRLQKAFAENHIDLDVKADHIVAKNSSDLTREKIREIILTAGFVPLISEKKIEKNFAFTIVPYRLPKLFRKANYEENLGSYLNLNEISRALTHKKFVPDKTHELKDRQFQVNTTRSYVLPPLNNAISEIISKYSKNDLPIVEIGSGTGYSFAMDISNKIIRTQPYHVECQLLSDSISDPIYQMDIEEIHRSLSGTGKKISLFVGLNVFDAISPEKRKESFMQISTLQNAGDHILILLDAMPLLDSMIPHLESLYPQHAIFPFYPPQDHEKALVVIVPLEYVGDKPSLEEIVDIFRH